MNEHVDKEHDRNSENIEFDFKIMKKFNEPLPRQLKKAYDIGKENSAENLNWKTEYNYQSLNTDVVDLVEGLVHDVVREYVISTGLDKGIFIRNCYSQLVLLESPNVRGVPTSTGLWATLNLRSKLTTISTNKLN